MNMPPSTRKIVGPKAARALRDRARRAGKRVVFTNGCFDLLHAGHVAYLEAARRAGDLLIVGLNDDASVRRLKGPERPVQKGPDRARMLAGLAAVDAVVFFSEDTPAAIVSALRPDVLVKGADWKPGTIVGADTVKAGGGRVVRVRLKPGVSTSSIIARIRAGAPAPALPQGVLTDGALPAAMDSARRPREIVSAGLDPGAPATRKRARRGGGRKPPRRHKLRRR